MEIAAEVAAATESAASSGVIMSPRRDGTGGPINIVTRTMTNGRHVATVVVSADGTLVEDPSIMEEMITETGQPWRIDRDALLTQIKDAQDQIATLQQQLTTVTNDGDAQRTRSSAEIQQLQTDLNRVQDQLSKLSQEHTTLTTTTHEWQREKSLLMTQIPILESELADAHLLLAAAKVQTHHPLFVLSYNCCFCD
jgi:chromosome segregation ATPase